MVQNISGFVVLFIISIAISLIVYVLARESLRGLLDEVVKLPSGTTFYVRLFLIGIVFIALSSALDTEFALKEDAAFMEYAWKVADGLSTVFGYTCLYILGYLTLVTILVAVLRHRHDK
jgi:ABC-type Fe3+-siderophore transport system permease subunit